MMFKGWWEKATESIPTLLIYAIVLCGITIPSGYALVFHLRTFQISFLWLQGSFVLLITGFLVALFRRWITLTTAGVAWLLALQAFLRFCWYEVVKPDIFHDFAIMWAQALRVIDAPGFTWSSTLYFCRSLPFYLPLNLLSRDNQALLAAANSALIFFVTFATYVLLKHHVQARFAQAACLLSGCAPELFAASAIPSHDIVGTFFVFALFGLFYRIQKSSTWRSYVLWGVLMAATTVVLHLQRLPTDFLIPFFAIVALVLLVCTTTAASGSFPVPAPAQRRGMLVALVAVIAGVLLIKAAGLRCTSARLDAENAASYWHAMSDGTWAYKGQKIQPLFAQISDGDLATVASTLLLNDLIDHPVARLRTLALKSERLYGIGATEAYFYNWNGKRMWPPAVEAYKALSGIYRLIWLCLLCLSSAAFLMSLKQGRWAQAAPAFIYTYVVTVVFLGIFSGAMLFLGEVSPRYMFPIYFVGPLLIAPALEFLGRDQLAPGNTTCGLRGVVQHAGATVVLCAVVWCLLGVALRVAVPAKKRLHPLAAETSPSLSKDLKAEYAPLGNYGQDLRYTSRQQFEYQICDNSFDSEATVRVFTADLSGPPGEKNPSGSTCQLSTETKSVDCAQSGFYEVPSAPSGHCHRLRLSLDAQNAQHRWIGLVSIF